MVGMPYQASVVGPWPLGSLALAILTACPLILYYAIGGGWLFSAVIIFLGCFLFFSLRRARLLSFHNYFILSFLSLNLVPVFFDGFSVGEKERNYIWMTLGALYLYLLGYYLFSSKSDKRDYFLLKEINGAVGSLGNVKFFLLFLPVALAGFLILIEVVSSGGLLKHSRAATKEGGAFVFLIIKYLLVFSMPFCFLLGLGVRMRNGIVHFSVLVFFIFLLVLFFLGLRTRSYIVGPSVTYLAGFFCSYLVGRGVEKVAISSRMIISIVVSLLLVLVVSAYSRFYRGALEVQGTVNYEAVIEQTIYNGDLGYGIIVKDIMHRFKEEGVSLGGQSYYRLLFSFVPRSVWPDKPENTQQIVGELMGGKVDYFTLPPGVQGDAYINFGFVGVFIFFFYGACMARVDSRYSAVLFLVASSSFLPVYHFARGGFTNPVIMIFVIWVAGYFLRNFYLKGFAGR